MKKKDEFENLMLYRLDKCFKRYDIKHYLFIQPTDLTKACFCFLIIFFPDGFKDHPTSVDKDKLRKSTNSRVYVYQLG